MQRDLEKAWYGRPQSLSRGGRRFSTFEDSLDFSTAWLDEGCGGRPQGGGSEGEVFASCSYFGLDLEFVYNPCYEGGNGLSVLCAKDRVGERFVLSMVDHIFDPEALKGMLEVEEGKIVIAVASKPQLVDHHEATKVRIEKGKVVAIGKNIYLRCYRLWDIRVLLRYLSCYRKDGGESGGVERC